MAVRRGEIWWANLQEPIGSEPGFRRPVVIIQSNDFNRSGIRTILVAAIYSDLRQAACAGNVVIETLDTGLAKSSVINVSQIVAIDRLVLSERVCQLQDNIMDEVDEGLRLVLSL